MEIPDPHAAKHHGIAHVTSVGLLAQVLLALVILTIITVWASNINFHGYDVWVAMAISVTKASIVALYFMHLRWGEPLYAYAFIGALICLFVFIVGLNVDVAQVQPGMIPDYAPAMQQDQ